MQLQQIAPLCDRVKPLFTRWDDLFAKIIVTDYYDGPTSGIGLCSDDCSAYKFQMLDWSDDTEVRIFRVTRISLETFDRLVYIYSRIEPPHWPAWILGYQNSSESTWADVDSDAESVLDTRKMVPECILAWRNSDNVILSIRAEDFHAGDRVSVGSELGQNADDIDWFAYLGLEMPHI